MATVRPVLRGKRLDKTYVFDRDWALEPQWARNEKWQPSSRRRAENEWNKQSFYSRVWGLGPLWARNEKWHPSGRNRAETVLQKTIYTPVFGRELKNGTRQAGTARKTSWEKRVTLVSRVWDRSGREMKSGTRRAHRTVNELKKHVLHTSLM